MGRRLRIAAIGLLGVSVLAGAGLAIALHHAAPCPASAGPGVAAGASGGNTMVAILQRCYGPPESLELARLPRPEPGPGQVRVRVVAASVNPLDWHYVRGEPRVMRLASGMGRPREPRLGADYAGVIDAVGPGVMAWRPGDEVFGMRAGAFGEYLVARADGTIARKPENLDFAQAAALPVAALTALQALRDHGALRPGQKVLVNGASGGVGTYAVQMAKAMGAEVTGVCSTRNVALVRGLGADRVIDYTREDFAGEGAVYDLVVDMVGNRAPAEVLAALRPGGTWVVVGGPSDGPWLGPVASLLRALAHAPFASQRIVPFFSVGNRADLEAVARMAAAGKLRPVIERRHPLREVPAAIEYVERGRARGKVVIEVAEPPGT
ncbi:MAG: NAD(P)-dependent alcohol dehydrogenase [Steroidobacteraceae bacterium]|jgi:NADPH:quinone reductase-like Zn-dependent oxidoreductase|nr:NAD(P)-dependent alcohol dehydrogenase [Steroidobacteraceae bacterium]